MKTINNIPLPSGALLIFEILQQRSHKTSFAYCSNQHLADVCGYKKNTVSKYMALLEAAGMIARSYLWEDDKHTVKMRRVFCAKKKVYMQPQENPAITMKDVCAMLAEQMEEADLEEDKKEQRRRIFKHADLMGIRRLSIVKALYKWGADYVEEKLNIAAAGHARNPVDLFFKACWADYKPNKRQKKNVGKKPKERRFLIAPDEPKPAHKPTAREILAIVDKNGYSYPPELLKELKASAAAEAAAEQTALDIKPAEQPQPAAILPPVQVMAMDAPAAPDYGMIQRNAINARGAKREAYIMQMPADRRDALREFCARYDAAQA